MILCPLKPLRPSTRVPTYATDGSAAFDIYADLDTEILLDPGQRVLIPTGFSVAIPKGQCLKMYPRSGVATKHGIRLANCTAIIDSDYRGEVMVSLINDDPFSSFRVCPNDRIAQGMIEPVEHVIFDVVGELPATERGGGGFGSTGR